MRQTGVLLILLGAALVLFAFNMDTTVTTSGTFIAGSYVGGGATHNLGLLQQQMMFLHTGLAAFLAGAILYGCSARELGSADGHGENVPAPRNWRDAQGDETEDERNERLERLDRRRRVGIIISVALLVGILLLGVAGVTMNYR